jgi:hypothetical protein
MQDEKEQLLSSDDFLEEVKSKAVKRVEALLQEEKKKQEKYEKEFIECMKNKENWDYNVQDGVFFLFGIAPNGTFTLGSVDMARLLKNYLGKDITDLRQLGSGTGPFLWFKVEETNN